MGWVSGRVMMGEDVDHGESEAGYFKSNDDTSIDPDIALSYIDEKLENVLGHLQKDFEGGVSAENLGAKFGGYGSFLPTYQRSPSIPSQPKSPQRVHTNITHTPDHVHREGAAKSSSIPDALLHERDGNAAARNTHSLYDDKVQVEKIFDVPSDQVVEKLPLKQRPSPKKSLSLTGQKSLKFRIKVGSDKSAQKNVAIYSGLGLSSPSTSPGNSPGESSGIPVESLVNPDKSPTRILQMLSTLTVVLEPLLSPLPDRLMNLLRDMPSEGKSTQALKDKRDHSIVGDGYNSKAGGEEIYTGTKSNASRKCELAKEDAILLRVKEKSGAKVLDSRPCGSSVESPKQQLRSIDNDGGSFGNSSTAMNTLKEPEKGNRMKNRKLVINRIKGTLSGAEAVKDNSLRLVSGQGGNKLLHQEARSSSVEKIKDSPVDFPESRRKKVNGITISSNIDSDSFESDRESKGAADHLLQEGGLGSTSGECDKLRMPGCKKKFTSESKSKSKISQVYGKISSKSVDDGRKASLSANPRQKKGSKKDTSTSRELYEDLFGHSEVSGCPVGSLEKPSSGDKSKSSNDAVKDERGNSDRLKLKSSQKQVKNQPTSQSLVKDSLKYNVPSTSGLLSEMEHAPKAMEVVQATVPPVLLEDWVECDRCQQWRLLPYGRTEQLPEKWVCSMLDWLPGMNSCDFTEDETTEALRALYRLPLPNNQNSSQYTADRAVTGVSSVDAHCSNLGNSNVDSHNNIANGSKKMHKAKETSHKGGKPVLNMTIAPRNLEQGPVMRESLNASDSIDQHHSGSGEAKLKKSSKRVSDQHVRSTAKKVKTGRTSDIISSPTSVGSLGRIEFGSTTSVATVAPSDMQESDGCICLKGAKSDQGFVLRTRKPKEDMIDTNRGSFDARHFSDGCVSLKKIKLKDHKNSQNNVNAMKNDGHSLPHDNKVPVVENGVTGFRKNKKPTVNQIEGTLVSGTNGDLQMTQKDVKNRMLSSGVQSRKLDKGVDKEKQLRPFKIKVTSQLTMEDLESLKKDLASEPVPAAAAAAANSSSSKVSDSRKTKLHYSENRGSPVESVCSSPVRLLTIGKLLPLKVECLSHEDVKEGDFRTVGSPIKVENGDIQQSGKARPKRTLGAAHQEFLDNCGNGHLEGNRPCTLEGHDPCLSKEPPFDPYPDKNPSNKRLRTVSLHKKNGKVSPTLPKDRERSLNHKEEPERGSLPRERQKLSNPKRNAKVVVEVGQGEAAPSVEGLGDVNHQNCTSRSVKITKASKKHVDETRGNQSKRGQHENSDANVNNPCAMDASVRSQDFQSGKRKKNLSVVDFGDEKTQVNQHPQDKHDLLSTKVTVVKEDRKKDPVLSQPRDLTGRSEQSKELKDFKSPLRGIASCVPGASVVLKEAEGFRDYADRLKNNGFGYECNETYFQAALKFLHGASLLERPNESSKHGDMNQMQIYIYSAKLCETCAEEYERRQEMAAAALVYKCMEVAYLRVVYCKNVTANRLCHDLQASLQLVPQGESPSSSASDIDNLNNLALVEKGSTLSKSTHFGNHILASRSRPSFAQLLDFTEDVNSAMEATRKSHDALASANVILEKAKNMEGILSVKRVIDFSFQDVEELVRLVGFAKEAINRKALRGNRN